ncbi:MAG: hypothetical protein C0487_04865 [Leptothrix sp. (in: Bacteria)]|nr:hypothetical protein [Leptothrix sp. (in: b-proteobacteria)]
MAHNGEPFAFFRHRQPDHRVVGAVVLAWATSLHTSVSAQVTDEPRSGPTIEQVAESTRSTVRSTVEWLASGVDSWFGDKPFSEGGEVTQGQLSLSLLKRQDQSLDTGVRFNARLRLPNFESYKYLFVGNDNQREVITDQPEAFSRQQLLLPSDRRDSSFFAGFGMKLLEAVDFRLGFRSGLKPYAQVRYRHDWQLSATDRIDFRETLFLTRDDRLGSTTVGSYEHAFSPTLAARWLNAATITQQSPKFAWSSNLGLHQSFGAQRVLSLEALFSGVAGAAVPITDLGLQTKWVQPIHQDFVLGEIIAGHFWPRTDASIHRGRAWALGGVITLKF